LVRPGAQAAQRLTELLDGVDALAADRRVGTVIAGVSAAREQYARVLLARGDRVVLVGVAMHRDGNAHHRHEVWALDDWR
jgi:hypothetical protein